MNLISRILVCGIAFCGKTVKVLNGKVYIDGKRIKIDTNQPKIDIVVEGNLEHLEVESVSGITVNGYVGTLVANVGDVTCGEVRGDVTCDIGDVTCGAVGGSVSSQQGDISSGAVGGDIHTSMGDVTCTTVAGSIHTSMGDVNVSRG